MAEARLLRRVRPRLNALVVPSNRPEHLYEFLEAWSPLPWDRVIVIEDGPEITMDVSDAKTECWSWAEIEAELPQPWIISRRDSGIRAFGFWRAWQLGAEVTFTLDDDCHPASEDLIAGHRRNLFETAAWGTSVPGMRVRGLPYRDFGGPLPVDVSVGLWVGTPDLDSVETLANGTGDGAAERVVAAGSRVMPSEQYFPMSGMNLAVRREAACLMYYPPMGEGSPFGRFDDIWCGLVVQRICRHLRRSIVCGQPLVEHKRASDPLVNLVREAPGIAANETVWRSVDEVTLTADTPLGCLRELGAGFAAGADPYRTGWGRAVLAWCDLFEEAPA